MENAFLYTSRIPRTDMKSFPLNAWYAAAYDVQVKSALLARTVCGQKLVLFRRKDASLAVLEDACWHLLLPLSMGRLEYDQVTCGYHGLVYNGDGRCDLREGVASIFREDELILEAQQQALEEHPGYGSCNLNIDAGAMWARRLIDKMIEAEASATQPARVVPIRPAA